MGPHFDYNFRATNNPSYFALPDKQLRDAASQSTSETDSCSRSAPSRVWADGSRSLGSPRKREPESPRRKEFRALLRSLSVREPEQAEGFLRGQPRPGDCAPGDMRHISTAPRIRKGKISTSVVTPTGVQEREEVFYTIPLQGRRRHSLGGYLAVGGSGGVGEVTAVPCEVPRMPAPKPQHTRLEEDLVKRRRPKNIQFKGMEDIAIVWSDGSPKSEQWSDHLIACFDKIMSQRARHHYRVTPMTAAELMCPESKDTIEKLAKSQLQIILLCPNLATQLSTMKNEIPNCETVFKADKVLTMLLGVERDDVIKENIKNYPNLDQWQMMPVRDKDPTFVDTFLTAAVGILRTKDCKDATTDRTSFSILPKKVKAGQSRVIALLNDPIREEDSIKIIIDKKGEVIQIPMYKKRNPYTLQFDIPESCLEVSMLIWVRVSKNGQSLGRRQIKCESRLRELDQLLRASDHPLEFMCQTLGFKTSSKEQLDSWMLSAFQKNIPPHFNLLSSTEHFNPRSDASSNEEYPTLMHWAARFGLERLSWQLLECPGGGAACALRNVRQLTPAELAKENSHQRLADVLASHLQMNEFSNMYYYLKNMSENNKDDNNVDKVDNKFSDELRIVEDVDTVDCAMNNIAEIIEKETTDPFSEKCTQSLENRLESNKTNHDWNKIRPKLKLAQVPREQLYQNDFLFPLDDTASRIQQAIEHDYLVQPSNIKVESCKVEIPKFKPNNLYMNSSRLMTQQSDVFLYSPTEEAKGFTLDTPTSDISQINLNPKECRSVCGGSIKSDRESGCPLNGQDELAEIINDFKNNVFSISEVEKLVMEWRNRNETQQSLKEKQDQLNKMRHEYDKIQQRIKDKMKRPTPFERVKKMFSKSKSKNIENGTIEKRNGSIRPNSSLSESSSSSGRLSTVSGGSLGDHSVHSQIDDRSIISSSTLTMQSSTNELDIKLDDYLIPPPPRPVNGGYPVLTTFGHPRVERARSASEQTNHSRGLMATIVERDTTASRERLNGGDTESSHGTHVLLTFDSKSRTRTNESERNTSNHMYMNISPHT